MNSTEEVLDHHLECFGRGDLDGILTDYSSTAVMFTPEGPLKGSAAMKQRAVDGDYAYILWSAETADNVYEMGTDTFVVRNGQIIVHSFAGKIRPKR